MTSNMLSRALRLTAVCGAVSLGGCDSDPSAPLIQLAFDVQKNAYTHGEVIRGRITNGTDVALGYAAIPCALVLERKMGDDWKSDGLPQPLIQCDASVRSLAPGGAVDVEYAVDPQLPIGEYRLRIPMWPDDGYRNSWDAVSDSFQVRATS